jgi:hypothetical protein
MSDAFYEALREAGRVRDREIRVLSVALYVAATADATIANGPDQSEDPEEWDKFAEFAADLREAQRLAVLYAKTRCTDVERIAVEDARRILFDALGEEISGSL